MIAVGIKFGAEAERTDLAQQFRQILMQAGLAAGDCDAVKQSFSFLQTSKQFFIIHDRLRRAARKLEIVTVRAAEITPAQKNGAGNVSRIVKKRHLLKSVYFHEGILLLLRKCRAVRLPQECAHFLSPDPECRH